MKFKLIQIASRYRTVVLYQYMSLTELYFIYVETALLYLRQSRKSKTWRPPDEKYQAIKALVIYLNGGIELQSLT